MCIWQMIRGLSDVTNEHNGLKHGALLLKAKKSFIQENMVYIHYRYKCHQDFQMIWKKCVMCVAN